MQCGASDRQMTCDLQSVVKRKGHAELMEKSIPILPYIIFIGKITNPFVLIILQVLLDFTMYHYLYTNHYYHKNPIHDMQFFQMYSNHLRPKNMIKPVSPHSYYMIIIKSDKNSFHYQLCLSISLFQKQIILVRRLL